MEKLLASIADTDAESVSRILDAALNRYRALFPQWDITMISIDTTRSREEQLEQIIEVLCRLR